MWIHSCSAIPRTCLSPVVVFTVLSLCLTGTVSAAITIRTLAGDNAINNVKRGTGFEPVVQVLDRSGTPLQGATVTFYLPSVGPGGTFPDGNKSLTVQTDESGRAAARGFRPNSLTGQFDIRISGSHAGETASIVVRQTNAAPAVEARSNRRLLILGLVAGAVAGGILAAQGGGSSGSPNSPGSPSPSDPIGGTVTPGTPGFGPPR